MVVTFEAVCQLLAARGSNSCQIGGKSGEIDLPAAGRDRLARNMSGNRRGRKAGRIPVGRGPGGANPFFSPRGEAKCVRGPSVQGARRLAPHFLNDAGVLSRVQPSHSYCGSSERSSDPRSTPDRESTLSKASTRNAVMAGLWRASTVGCEKCGLTRRRSRGRAPPSESRKLWSHRPRSDSRGTACCARVPESLRFASVHRPATLLLAQRCSLH